MSETVDNVSAAKKAILRDLNAPAEDIQQIRTNAEADEYITYLRGKQPPKEEKDKLPIMKLNAGMGKPIADLPDPEDPDKIRQKKFNQTLLDKMDPVSAKQPCSRWNNASRMLLIFDDEHPNGSFF